MDDEKSYSDFQCLNWEKVMDKKTTWKGMISSLKVPMIQ